MREQQAMPGVRRRKNPCGSLLDPNATTATHKATLSWHSLSFAFVSVCVICRGGVCGVLLVQKNTSCFGQAGPPDGNLSCAAADSPLPPSPHSPLPTWHQLARPPSTMTTTKSLRRHFRFRHHHPPSLLLLLLLMASFLLRSASFAFGTRTTRPLMSAVRDALASPQKALQSQALVQSLLGPSSCDMWGSGECLPVRGVRGSAPSVLRTVFTTLSFLTYVHSPPFLMIVEALDPRLAGSPCIVHTHSLPSLPPAVPTRQGSRPPSSA